MQKCEHGWTSLERDCPLCQPPDIPADFFPYRLGAKLPPRLQPLRAPSQRTLETCRTDFIEFLVDHTLMNKDVAAHCAKLIENLIDQKRADEKN